jgi:hypothetical protein
VLGISISVCGRGNGITAPPLPTSGLLRAWDFTQSPIMQIAGDTDSFAIPADPNAPEPTSLGHLFDGVDDYVSAAPHPYLGAAGTVLCVARTERSYPSDSGAFLNRGLVANTSSGVTAGIAWGLEWNGDNVSRYLRLLIGDGSALNTVVIAFNPGTAFHVLGGRWGGGALSVWSDGVQLHSETQSVNANTGIFPALKVGQIFAATSNAWSGEIAFVALYTTALTDLEMAQAHAALRAMYPALSL